MTDADHTKLPTYLVEIPGGANGSYATYFRLGGVDADEANLQQDPAGNGGNTRLIGVDHYLSAYAAGTLSYTLGTTMLVAPNVYARLGPAAPGEVWLQTDPAGAKGLVNASGTRPPDGILLHTMDTMQLFAPTINQVATTINTSVDSVSTWGGESYSAVFNDKRVASVEAITKDLGRATLKSSSLTVGDSFSTTVGDGVSSTIGRGLATWTGIDNSMGSGSLLWSNHGTTQNVFSGNVVNIINDSVSVQGWGEMALGDVDMVAPRAISFTVFPGANTLAGGVLSHIKGLNRIMAAVTTALSTSAAAMLGVGADRHHDTDEHFDWNMKTKTLLDVYSDELRLVADLVIVTQIMAIFAGIQAHIRGEAGKMLPLSKLRLAQTEAVLQCGESKIRLSEAGIHLEGPRITLRSGENSVEVNVVEARLAALHVAVAL